MMMLFRALRLATIFAALSLVFGSSAHAQSQLTAVTVGLVPTDDITPLVYAIQTGMFKNAGLDVTLEAGNSGTAMAAAVVSGSYTFGKSSLLAIINAHLRKLPLAMIGSEAVYDAKAPYAELMVANDSPVKSCKDLNGKIVGTPALNDLDSLATMACVGQAGGDPTALKLVELPQSASIASVQEHRVEATILHEPVLAQAIAANQAKVLAPAYSAISPHFVFASYFTADSYAQAHPDIVKKFMDTVYRAAAYTNAHHQATAQMMADETKAPLDIVEKMNRVDGATSTDPKEIQPLIDAAAKYHLIPAAFPASDLIPYAPK